MYGKHVILYDSLTQEMHDALVVGSQAAHDGGPEELLNLAYVRKDAPKHALHEHRILYRMAVRPADHLDVKAGKVTHWYKVPNEGVVAVGNKAQSYSLFLDEVQLNNAAPGDEIVGLVIGGKRFPRAIRDVVVGDVLAIGPYPEGSTVKSITTSDDGTMVNVLAESNQHENLPTMDSAQTGDGAGDPAQVDEAALAAQAAHDTATGNSGEAPAPTVAEAVAQ